MWRCATWCAWTWKNCTRSSTSPLDAFARSRIWSSPSLPRPDWRLRKLDLICAAISKHLVRLRFGDKVAAPDPRDIEAMKAFQAQGGTIVVGLSKGEWANVRRSGAVLPAGQICPTAKPYSLDPNAKRVDLVAEKDWTDGMK